VCIRIWIKLVKGKNPKKNVESVWNYVDNYAEGKRNRKNARKTAEIERKS